MSRQGENIRLRRDGRWEARVKSFDEFGNATLKSIYGRSYQQVKERTLLYLRDPADFLRLKGGIPFETVLIKWLDDNSVRLKGGTISKYRQLISGQIVPSLGKMAVEDITAVIINQFLREKLTNGRADGKGGLSPSTVKTIMDIVLAARRYASENGLCEPLAGKVFRPAIQSKEARVLDMGEQRKLEAFLKEEPCRVKVGICLALHAGLRLGEICALSWNDVDFAEKVIHIRHTVARVMNSKGDKTCYVLDSPKTKSSKRDIPMTDYLFTMLSESLRDARSPFVVSAGREEFLNPRSLESMFIRVLRKASLPRYNFHALRHTFATRCVEAGVDVKTLSEILGHSSVKITLDIYVHSSMELKRLQLEKLYSYLE